MIRFGRMVAHRCPHANDDVDIGELEIELPDDAPELHALARQIDTFADVDITHEEYTRQIAKLLPTGARVHTTWRTGGWLVDCYEEAP